MAVEEFRKRARATWAAGDWDSFARLIEKVGALALDRVGVEPGVDLLDVGTGTGGNVAIPAAQRGARVVGLDITPELLAGARLRADAAGVDSSGSRATRRSCRSATRASTAWSRRSGRCSRPTTRGPPPSSCASAARAGGSR